MIYLIEFLAVIAIVGGLLMTWFRQNRRSQYRSSRPGRDLISRRKRPSEPVAAPGEELKPVARARRPINYDMRTVVDEHPPDGRRVRKLAPVATRLATVERPMALAIAAESSAPMLPQQDVYYVQRNVIALARGLQPADVGQRAAALALSAVIASRIGRTSEVPKALRSGILSANRVVRSIRNREPGYSDMLTTLDIVVLATDDSQLGLHFAHVGNSTLWLRRADSSGAEALTQPHAIEGGPLLRAIGLSVDVIPDVGHAKVRPGDRIFLTTTSPAFSFQQALIDTITANYAAEPLGNCVTVLADMARSAGGTESVTVAAAEVGDSARFAV